MPFVNTHGRSVVAAEQPRSEAGREWYSCSIST